MEPKVVILSGGPNSVHLEGSPRVPEGFFEYCQENSIPVLGICYGMQVWKLVYAGMRHTFLGSVRPVAGQKIKELGYGVVAVGKEAPVISAVGRHMLSCWL